MFAKQKRRPDRADSTGQITGGQFIHLDRHGHKLNMPAGWVCAPRATEMDELPACDLPGAVHGDGDQGVAAKGDSRLQLVGRQLLRTTPERMTQQLLDQSAQLVVLYRQLAHLPCLPSPRTARPAPA